MPSGWYVCDVDVIEKTTTSEFADRRTQQQRRATTRAALLASAAEVVVDTGPGSSVGEIARRAGLSKGALQHHFESKSDLLAAVVAMGWDDLAERFALLSGQSLPLGEHVAAVVHAMWDSYRQPACRAAFMISSDPNLDRDSAARLAPVFETSRRRLDELWRGLFADFDVSAEQLALSRRFARAHLLGMLVQRQLPSEEPDPESELVLLCDALLHLLNAERPR
jgi:AcrR family transcriptional regulator